MMLGGMLTWVPHKSVYFTSFITTVDKLPRTEIGPEQFAFIPSGSNMMADDLLTQLAFNEQHSFYPTQLYYYLHPEVLE